MKNVINKKILQLFKYSMAIFLVSFVFNSCQDSDLEIQHDFPFEVQIMPVTGKIAENETVEIRI